MTEYLKLIAARQQIENIVELTKENEWKDYLYRHLVQIHVELERQIEILVIKGENTVLTGDETPPTLPE